MSACTTTQTTGEGAEAHGVMLGGRAPSAGAPTPRRPYPYGRRPAGAQITAAAVTDLLHRYGPLRGQQIAYYLAVAPNSVPVPLARLVRAGILARRNETPAEWRERTSLLGMKRRAENARWKCAKYAYVYELPLAVGRAA